jgi:hypothetical protein
LIKLSRVIERLSNREGVAYTFGRFSTVRWLYARSMQCRQLGGNSSPVSTAPTIFPNIVPEQAISELRRDAICFGFNLGPESVRSILDFSSTRPLKHETVDHPFTYAEVSHGKLADGRAIPMAFVPDAIECDAVKAIVEDSVLQRVVREYLGYVPLHADVNLYWSFTVEMPPEERLRKNQTVDYHFDVHDFNFCYAHFYITDCDERSGAHMMVRGSHKHKRLEWMFGSARKTDAEIAEYFQAQDVLTVRGAAGTGFVEDTSCMHKALPPVDRERLMLQIRFH